ncbi:hypothetical protein BD779DRAFT_990614 [Infundibulicybe gibba]|nr:hypothetical protein BD779DRAFT_990614 [Infundibulicybe gibba]
MSLQIFGVPENATPVNVLFSSEYLSAFSVALAAWDHAITLDSEVLYIWSRSRLPLVTKVAYISNRYIADGICNAFFRISIIVDSIAIAFTQSIVAWEIFNLWERRTTIARLLIITSTICIPALLIAGVQCVRNDLGFLLVPLGATLCSFASFKSPWIQTAFSIITVFDLVIILLVISNALARPRRTNHDLVFSLHRDGAVMYTAVLATRAMGFVIAIAYDTSTSYVMLLPTFVISTTINCRLMARAAELQDQIGRDSDLAGTGIFDTEIETVI